MTVTKNLKTKYQEDVVPALQEKFGYKNEHQVHKLPPRDMENRCGQKKNTAHKHNAVFQHERHRLIHKMRSGIYLWNDRRVCNTGL